MKKINFKQPKYIFPLVIYLPAVFLAYEIGSLFGGGEKDDVAADKINMELPDARTNELGGKYESMTGRYAKNEAWSAVGELGREEESKDTLDNAYSDEELEAVIAEAMRKDEEQKRMMELQARVNNSGRNLPAYGSYQDSGNVYDRDPEYQSYLREVERIRRMSGDNMDKIEGEDADEKAMREALEQQRLREAEERERNRPLLVLKSSKDNADKFTTIRDVADDSDSPLIKAMIDRTTKAHEGTRLRFKLLDDVTIKDVFLPKGSYLYGNVTGFSQQRVKANITSVLYGSRFIKIDLAVYDLDGMEGFYVPSSAFRDFMKQAGQAAMGSSVQFNSNSSDYGSGINGEAIALQALQNVYTAGTQAVSANLRKNKAKIKYNTTVYLINSQDAR